MGSKWWDPPPEGWNCGLKKVATSCCWPAATSSNPPTLSRESIITPKKKSRWIIKHTPTLPSKLFCKSIQTASPNFLLPTVKKFKESYLAVHHFHSVKRPLYTPFTVHHPFFPPSRSLLHFYPFLPSSGACEVAAKLLSLPLCVPPPCHKKNRVSSQTHTRQKNCLIYCKK